MSELKVTVDEKEKTMTIVVPLTEPELSNTRKTFKVASTRGNFKTTCVAKDDNGDEILDKNGKPIPIMIGLNAYYKNPDFKGD